MKYISFYFLFIFPSILMSQDFEIGTKEIISFGNLADIENKAAYATLIRDYIFEHPNIKALVLNGDLIHEKKDFNNALASVDSFLQIISVTPIQIIIIPGDRDWDSGSKEGWNTVKTIENFVAERGYKNVFWPIQNGCPGPELIDIGDNLKLIAVQTQWWNHPHLVPSPASADCNIATEEAFFESLEDMMEEYTTGNLVIAGHMPLFSNGRYGGRFPLKDWLLPIPGISTFKTSFKQNIGTQLDNVNKRFLPFRKTLLDMFADHFSMVYLSGHDYTTEVILDNKNIFINAGVPDEVGYIGKSKKALIQKKIPGFIHIKFAEDGAAFANFVGCKNYQLSEALSIKIFQAPCKIPVPNMPVNERLVPCADPPNVLDKMASFHPAITTTIANPNYEASYLQKKWLGKHYRDSWTKKVSVDVLNLDTIHGGLKPYLVGGGDQTKSLRLRSSNGLDYVFRSVDKNPDRGLRVKLRSTLLSIILKDQTTTQQPYGALAVASLLDKTDILHASPSLYMMPNDKKLGPFQEGFGSLLGYLEERPSTSFMGKESHFDEDVIRRTISMFRKMYQNHTHKIDTKNYLEARMFDILIGDWSKEEDNWTWAGFKSDSGVIYKPIPKDRDDAFSLWDGIIPWLADREWAKDDGENFNYEINGIRSLTWSSRHMDRFLANEMKRSDWEDAAFKIQSQLNESSIRDAIQKMPKEVANDQGIVIAEKLISRLNKLPEYATDYYKLLAKEVDVVGSNKDDFFEVTINDDKTLEVKTFDLSSNSSKRLIYHRSFIPSETKEVRIFGLQGNDRYEISGNVHSKILIRLIPGIGNDTISGDHNETNSAPYKRFKNIILYDQKDDVEIEETSIRLSNSKNSKAYYYDRTSFTYNKYLPLGFLYYTGDNGVSLKGGLEFTNQKYGKPDFSSKHRFEFLASSIGNFQLEYKGRWRHIYRKWDFVAGIVSENKNRFRYLFNFNSSEPFDRALLLAGYHTLHFRTLQVNAGFLNEYWKISKTYLGFSVERNSEQLRENTILSNEFQGLLGQNALTIVKTHFNFDLDFRDRKQLARRGMRIFSDNYIGGVISGADNIYGRNIIQGQYFTTLQPLTLALGAGTVWHHGEVPFYDREFYGQNNHLKGFRRNRFTGRKMHYLNAELRLELFNKPAAIIPYQLGLKFFYDFANVSITSENDRIKRSGYGAGIYFVPVKEEFVFNFLFGFSQEEKGLFIITVGKDF